jgi:peptidase inhibitor family I36
MNSLARHLVAIGGLVLPLLACQKSLPTAPSDLMTGITVYEHADYLGQSAHVTQDIKDLKDFKGPCERIEYSAGTVDTHHEWDDCISSIRVSPGWRATLYRDDDFDGDRLEVTSDISNLRLVSGRCDKGGFNDCVTSIRVLGP